MFDRGRKDRLLSYYPPTAIPFSAARDAEFRVFQGSECTVYSTLVLYTFFEIEKEVKLPMWATLNSSRKLFSFTPQNVGNSKQQSQTFFIYAPTSACNQLSKFGTVLYEISSFLHFSGRRGEGGGGWGREAFNQDKDRHFRFPLSVCGMPFHPLFTVWTEHRLENDQ